MSDDPIEPEHSSERPRGVGRRSLFGYLGAAGAGAVLGGGGVAAALNGAPPSATSSPTTDPVHGQTYSPFGEHQSGIITPKPAAMRAIAYTLKASTDASALARLMRIWTGDIEALMAGRPVPGDPAGELAQAGVSLTVTVGLGPRVFALSGLGRMKPTGFMDIPAMKHDRLVSAWSGGDLLVMVAADDDTTITYAADRLTRDASPFASIAWVQDGSWRGTDASGQAVTGRNLFGQVDGTANPTGDDLAAAIWPEEPLEWFAGGTCLVFRRVEMLLGSWNKLTRDQQDAVIGRQISSGAPLGEDNEFDALDLAATDGDGNLVIPVNAHARRAHPDQNSGRKMLRRGWNYEYVDTSEGSVNVTIGLLFLAFVADIASQFIPVQHALDAQDALNQWTTAIGSAVFAIPPGWEDGDWIASQLFE